MANVAPEDSLFVELGHVAAQTFQQATSFGRDPKGLTSPRMGCQKGFWSTMHEARTDLAMAFCLVFLRWPGGGIWSIDERLLRRSR